MGSGSSSEPHPSSKTQKGKFVCAKCGGKGSLTDKGRTGNQSPPDLPSNDTGPEEVRKTLLHVQSVDFKNDANATDHHTNEYDCIRSSKTLVIRRGQAFSFSLTFDRSYQKDVDRFAVVFLTGDNPKESNGTKVVLPLYKKPKSKFWTVEIASVEDKSITLTVKSSPKCSIGTWTVKVNSVNQVGQELALEEWTAEKSFYMLFNPWCKEDTVYSEDKEFLEDYVLADFAHIYSGNEYYIRPKPWEFAQFEDPVLKCVMYILENEEPKLQHSALTDPIKVVRKLTSVINSCDNNGILTGNWSGDYSGGISPLKWVGSLPIIEKYWDTKTSVNYGQCWVFSGVLTTCCRTIGIPARSVTNFSSAHDTDQSLTIDKYYDASGDMEERFNSDSIWNFHVWNDAWMSRPDLPGNYSKSGWQACDATPQEASDGLMCCGPCPLAAIKDGFVNMSYDGGFIFAEVNGDVCSWQFDEHYYDTSIMRIQKNAVGKKISTFDVRRSNREDITEQYKHLDETNERKSVQQAISLMSNSKVQEIYEENQEDKDIELALTDFEDVMFGYPFHVSAKVTNIGSEKRTLKVKLSANSCYYTGVFFKNVKQQIFEEELEAGASKSFTMELTSKEYNDKVCERCTFKLFANCKVIETGRVFFCDEKFELKKPTLEIKPARSTVKVGEIVNVKASFLNTVPKELTNTVLTIEGVGLQRHMEVKPGNVGAGKTFEYSFDIKPFKAGKRHLLLDFDSKEMVDVKGYCDIEVTE